MCKDRGSDLRRDEVIAKVRGTKSLSIDGNQKAERSRDWSKRAQKLEQKGVRIGALIWERRSWIGSCRSWCLKENNRGAGIVGIPSVPLPILCISLYSTISAGT